MNVGWPWISVIAAVAAATHSAPHRAARKAVFMVKALEKLQRPWVFSVKMRNEVGRGVLVFFAR